MGCCALAFTCFTRLLSLAFIVVALLCLPQYQKMIKAEFISDGETLYVPLLYCEPDSFTIEDKTWKAAANTTGTGECISKDILVLATTGTLLITILALIIFMIVDLAARRNCCKRTMSAGMGLFLIFILLQGGLESLAVSRECMFWEGVYQKIIDSVVEGGDTSLSVTTAKTHGDWRYSAATSAMAFTLSIFVLFDQILCLCTAKDCVEDNPDLNVDDGDLALTPVGSNSQDSKGAHPHTKNWANLT